MLRTNLELTKITKSIKAACTRKIKEVSVKANILASTINPTILTRKYLVKPIISTPNKFKDNKAVTKTQAVTKSNEASTTIMPANQIKMHSKYQQLRHL